jgi:HEAT repeat protein
MGTMQDHMETLGKHIAFLKSLDTDEYFDKEEAEISQYAGTAMKELALMGNDATGELVGLLNTDFTWSCYLALKILRESKDPSAVPALIDFLKKDSDDSLSNEEAMFALQDIGDPSIPPLLEELKQNFEHKRYHFYLVGAFTGIIGPVPYEFMVTVTKEFLSDPAHYRGWFHIDDFTFNFVKQGRADAIPLLKQALEVRTLSGSEKEELRDTIRALEDPAAYQKEIQDTVDELSDNAQKLYS